MSNTVYIVILSHEHGDDVCVRKSVRKAKLAAAKMIEGTISEIEDQVDGDEDGVLALSKLREHLKNNQYKEAIALYNELYENHFSDADSHYLRIKKSNLK